MAWCCRKQEPVALTGVRALELGCLACQVLQCWLLGLTSLQRLSLDGVDEVGSVRSLACCHIGAPELLCACSAMLRGISWTFLYLTAKLLTGLPLLPSLTHLGLAVVYYVHNHSVIVVFF